MTSPHGLDRRGFLAGSLAVGALAGCSEPEPPAGKPASPATSSASPSAGSSDPSWAPRPATVGPLSCIARQDKTKLALHTASGDVTFWGGVTLEPTLPGSLPGTFSAAAEDYRRWFGRMAELGIRIIRLRRVHPPAFYSELLRYNTEHQAAPLYLVQGATVPPSAYERDVLTSRAVTTAMSRELTDASGAVHGDLRRTGRTSATRPAGTWNADVSPWTVAWVLGDEWTPESVRRTNRQRPRAPRYVGRYFASTTEATAAEQWFAARLDELATLEAERGVSVPMAVANTAYTDPLEHPAEPSVEATTAAIDVTRITSTPEWPAGTFAAYEAFPYEPDFLNLEPDYQNSGDPYRAYLTALTRHHDGVPVLVTAFGVTSAIGSGAEGPNNRAQGHHSETEQTKIGADLLRAFADIGLAGGIFSAWHDDWSASTWNTRERYTEVAPARRILTHDPLTADAWSGLLAHDGTRRGSRTVHSAPQAGLQQVTVDHDEAWLYLTLFFSGRVTSPVEIGFDLVSGAGQGLTLPGGSGEPVYDVSLLTVPTMSTTTVYVRPDLDPARFDQLPVGWWPLPNMGGWNVQSLTTRRPSRALGTGRPISPKFLRVGQLEFGDWNPDSSNHQSLAGWQLARPDASKPAQLSYRLPWSMLIMADASARALLSPQGTEKPLTPIKAMNVTVESSTPGSPVTFPVTWPAWNEVHTTERLKSGARVIREALGELSVPRGSA